MFKLSERQGSRGTYCEREGLYLGPAILIECLNGFYQLRPEHEITTVLGAADGAGYDAVERNYALSPASETILTVSRFTLSDYRTQRYRWKHVSAIAEPTWHDNKCKDSDQAEPSQVESDYARRTNVSVSDAIKWVSELPFGVTLYF